MKKTRPLDSKAAAIRFGIELETKIPLTCGINVGGYHSGRPVTAGTDPNGANLPAPKFMGGAWRADRDGSIVCAPGELPCEFVSPILYGDEGVEHLCRFVEWLNAIGAKVDASCGVHITVGIESLERLPGRWVFMSAAKTDLFGEWEQFQGMRVSNTNFAHRLPVRKKFWGGCPQKADRCAQSAREAYAARMGQLSLMFAPRKTTGSGD